MKQCLTLFENTEMYAKILKLLKIFKTSTNNYLVGNLFKKNEHTL